MGSTRSSTRWTRNTMLPPPISRVRLMPAGHLFDPAMTMAGTLAPTPKTSNYSNAKGRFTGACAVGLDAQGWPPGTEFLDAETGRQKSPPKWVNAGRDQNPGCEWPEIPAERPYLASYRKRAVCGDWMVVGAARYEPVSEGKTR